MTYLLSIDPGLSTGIALGYYSRTEPYSLVQAWQVEGGIGGFNGWWGRFTTETDYETNEFGTPWDLPYRSDLGVVAEKWIPYPTPGHRPTLDSTYPLRMEGVLISLGLLPEEYPHPAWQPSSMQYPFSPPNSVPSDRRLAWRRKRRQEWLKEHGLWQFGSDLGTPDADDANSAISHAIVYLRNNGHEPTIRKFWPEEEQ